MFDFTSLDLLPIIQKALQLKGYKTPTVIQQKAIPLLMQGKDLLAIAQTGTGKTASFALPIIQKILTNTKKIKPARLRALIITPTRELVSQIQTNIKQYSKGTKLKSLSIIGGVGYRPQIQSMSKGQDIVVATPGRLLDLINDGHVLFEQLDFLVLDEADRLLDMGFKPDINKIISITPKDKQTILFSATMANDIKILAKSLLRDFTILEITPEAIVVEKIVQSVQMIEQENKPNILVQLLKNKNIISALVFTKTKVNADKVAKILLKNSISATSIHSNKSQGARNKAIRQFKQGKIKILVATDIAARGIDIENVSHVINYNIPSIAEDYVHRIGRTARAGKKGVAISLCSQKELKFLESIEKLIKINLKR